MPHPRPARLVILLLLLYVTGVAVAHASGAPWGRPVGEVLASGEAEGHDDHADEGHAHDEHGDEGHAHDEHGDEGHAHDEDAHEEGGGDEHAHDHAPAIDGARLLVASLDGPELAVLDAETGALVGRFTVPGPGRAHQLPDARLAAVVHPDANRVTFVHGGLTVVDHGDHADLLEGPPYVLATVNLGRGPGALFAAGNDVAVALDGGAAWLDARLLGVTLDFVDVRGGAAAEDGRALAVVAGHLVVASEEAVTVHDRRGDPIATFGGCPAPRGQAVLGATAAFGCADGVLLVSDVGGVFLAHQLRYPAGGPAGARVTTLAADEGVPFVVGDFGRGIVLVDAAARSLTPVALPAGPIDVRYADGGEVLLVLTGDGVLHALDPITGSSLGAVEVLEPWTRGAPRPSLTHLGDRAFVVDPAHAVTWVVDIAHLEVVTHLELPFTPGSAAVLAIPGATLH